ncbi:unnamed protein product [[Candida] boidinii]|nr:unnamed protein product [[Candida] boidinii]
MGVIEPPALLLMSSLFSESVVDDADVLMGDDVIFLFGLTVFEVNDLLRKDGDEFVGVFMAEFDEDDEDECETDEK